MQRQKVEIGSPDGSPAISSTTSLITVPQRPSSPRQFFERLYGHLETRSSENGENDIDVGTHAHKPPPCDTPYHSDGGSVSSPDISISDERTSLASFPAYDFYAQSKDYPQHTHPAQQQHHHNHLHQQVQHKLSYVSPPPVINPGVTANPVLPHGFPPGFPSDPHFSAGFTAFCKYISLVLKNYLDFVIPTYKYALIKGKYHIRCTIFIIVSKIEKDFLL